MRQLGKFNEEQRAKALGAFLYTRGITNEVRPSEDMWMVWIHNEAELRRAQEILQTYLLEPDDPKYKEALSTALSLLKREKQREQSERRSQRPKRLVSRHPLMMGKLTLGLVVVCIFVALVTKLGKDHETTSYLTMASYAVRDKYAAWSMFADLYRGQIWRLVTPIFLHFDFWHILFNLWWLKDLGSIIEYRHSSKYLAALVLGIAIPSNLAQFIISGSPLFGGMSGVVYGLLGYLWIRGRYDPSFGMRLNPQIVIFMLGWLVLCFTGWLGNIANAAHVAGLVVGGGWGYLSSRHWIRMLRR
ncbi:MAG: rhomboid family intramembrane serine protease [Myxococcales bacterium]|nr:rhomboid family intramembrane serine protease [Myxococcales bacterium]MCB9707428.1 rhomboid family intramembrane serine protease [Myxococcales bacterium]